ncbi:MAG: hypothetical protein ACRDNF_01020, partial [Streptosporangiaceae bacterium]
GKLSDLGYKVTIEPVDPETGELTAAGGSPHIKDSRRCAPGSRRHKPPPLKAGPAEVLFSGQLQHRYLPPAAFVAAVCCARTWPTTHSQWRS